MTIQDDQILAMQVTIDGLNVQLAKQKTNIAVGAVADMQRIDAYVIACIQSGLVANNDPPTALQQAKALINKVDNFLGKI